MSCILTLVLLGPSSWTWAEEKAAVGEAEAVIARVGDWRLTSSDLERIVGYYPAQQRELLRQDPKKLMTLVRRLVQAKVLSDKAYEQGLDERRDIHEQIELTVQDKLAQAYVQEKVMKQVSVVEEDVRLYYRSHKEDYQVPEQIRCRHLLLRVRKDAETAEIEAARKRTEAILEKIQAGEDFAVLAAAMSEDPGSREKGGDLGWVSRDKLDPAFAKAAFESKTDQVTGPVRSSYGFHLLRVEDRQPARQLPYESVSERIREELMSQLRANKTREFIEAAMGAAGATIDYDRLIDQFTRQE